MFFAVPVEDRLRSRLQELQEIALETLDSHKIGGIRAEKLENAHITVRFLGEVDDAEALLAAIEGKQLGVRAFDYCISEIGVFDEPSRARVLWAGVDHQSNFAELRRQLDELVSPFFTIDRDCSFHPHITLARFREPQDIRSCWDELRQLTDVCTIDRYTVREMVLYRSELSAKGATHTEQARVCLSDDCT